MDPILDNKFIEKYKVRAMYFFGIITLTSYWVYQYYWFEYNVKLTELNFSVTSLTISAYSLLIASYIKKNYHAQSFAILIGMFYLILDIIYVYRWVFLSKAYTDVKMSLFIGFLLALIYWIYGTFKYRGRD